jgi:hypothetical protein
MKEFFFSIDELDDNTNIQDAIINDSYIEYGLYDEPFRPSNYCDNAIKEYDIAASKNEGDNLAFKISKREFFKVFDTEAVVQIYHCASGNWYKYYFPLQKSLQKEFDYYEIVKVTKRTENKDIGKARYKRIPFICNLTSH